MVNPPPPQMADFQAFLHMATGVAATQSFKSAIAKVLKQ
jgi:hypothetical protein